MNREIRYFDLINQKDYFDTGSISCVKHIFFELNYFLFLLKAGIPSDQLMFVTETEAAFIYCHHSLGREHNQHLKDVTEYMVVNLGGILRFNMTCIFTNSF